MLACPVALEEFFVEGVDGLGATRAAHPLAVESADQVEPRLGHGGPGGDTGPAVCRAAAPSAEGAGQQDASEKNHSGCVRNTGIQEQNVSAAHALQLHRSNQKGHWTQPIGLGQVSRVCASAET